MAKSYFLRFGTGDPRTLTGLAPTFLIFESAGATIAPPSISEALTGSGIYTFTWGTTTAIAFLVDAATTSPGAAGRYVTGSLDPADRIDEVGTTLVAIGISNIALGTTNVALGTTNVALGVTSIAQGNTMIGLGTTAVALGITNIGFGSSNIALGTTNVAIGTTIYALEQNIGTTLVAIGNTGFAIGTSLYGLIGTTASLIGDSSTDPSTLFGYLKRLAELDQGQETFNKSTGALTMLDRTGATTLVTRVIANNATMVIKT